MIGVGERAPLPRPGNDEGHTARNERRLLEGNVLKEPVGTCWLEPDLGEVRREITIPSVPSLPSVVKAFLSVLTFFVPYPASAGKALTTEEREDREERWLTARQG